MITLRDMENVLRLVRALKESMGCSYEAGYLAHYLRYEVDQLRTDVEALIKVVCESPVFEVMR